jgi:hypothetical protein
MPNTSPFINVRDYGATGDGKTDDTAAIAAAIAAAAPTGGGEQATGNTVVLPAGKYVVSASLNLPPAVALEGMGWNTPGSQANVFAGSWLVVGAGASFSPVTIAGSGGSVRRLGFNVADQPKSGPPPIAAPMVHVTAHNALIEDVLLYNPYGGVYLDGAAQAVIRRLWGQPVRYGVRVDRSQDVNYVETVHFWPYAYPAGTDAAAYQLSHGTAIELFRCDNPHLSNIFAFNYNKGLSLSVSPAGTPHKVHLMNADFDGCVTGLHIDAPGQEGYAATLQMANVTVQSPGGGAPKSHGIWVEPAAAYAMVQASNVRVARSGRHAVMIEAENASFFGHNVSLERWGEDPGFSISAGSSFAYLDAGFSATGGDPYAPRRQFRLPKT